MKIFAIMLVKNEVDVVKYSILDAKRWADRIFVMDNGSTDGTWEIVQSLADEVVVPWKQDPQPFYDGLRADVFNHFRHESQNGDWWCCNLDADEFYLDDPRKFLAKIPKKYNAVRRKAFVFCLTQEDVKNYDFNGDFEKDRSHINKVEKKMYAELRFFRYKESFRWVTKSVFRHTRSHMIYYPEFITLKHYQYRSPKQMQVRIDTRRAVFEKTKQTFRHANQKDWQELLCKNENCISIDNDDDLRKLATELPVILCDEPKFSVPSHRQLNCRYVHFIFQDTTIQA